MNLLRLLAPALVLLAAPAHAGKPLKNQAVVEAPVDLAGYAEAMTAYGEWLQRLHGAMAAMRELPSLQAKWQAAQQTGTPETAAAQFRTTLSATRRSLQDSVVQLRALDTPRFPLLELTTDVEPATLKVQMLQLTADTIGLVDTFEPMLQAMLDRDLAAGQRAAEGMFGAARLMMDGQAKLQAAAMVTTDKGSATYQNLRLQKLVFESGSRLVEAATPALAGKTDSRLPADLDRFADQLDEITERGMEKSRAEVASVKETLAGLSSDPDEQAERILRKALPVIEMEEQAFAAGKTYSAGLRKAVADLRQGPPDPRETIAVLQLLRTMRLELDRIALAQTELLAK